MKISKLSYAICVLALGAGFSSVQAGDNEAQAAARAALESKFQSLSPEPASKAAPGKATGQQPGSPDSAAQKLANLAMEAEANALKQEQAAAKLQAEAKQQAEVARQARDRAIKARQEAEQAMAVADARSQINTVAGAQSTKQSATAAGTNAQGLKPMTAPSLPFSAAKQFQLDTLLDLYKANRISPADYQKQRALILAEK